MELEERVTRGYLSYDRVWQPPVRPARGEKSAGTEETELCLAQDTAEQQLQPKQAAPGDSWEGLRELWQGCRQLGRAYRRLARCTCGREARCLLEKLTAEEAQMSRRLQALLYLYGAEEAVPDWPGAGRPHGGSPAWREQLRGCYHREEEQLRRCHRLLAGAEACVQHCLTEWAASVHCHQKILIRLLEKNILA